MFEIGRLRSPVTPSETSDGQELSGLVFSHCQFGLIEAAKQIWVKVARLGANGESLGRVNPVFLAPAP